MGSSFLTRDFTPGPLHWERGVLASGPPEKSHVVFSDVKDEGVKQDSGILLAHCFVLSRYDNGSSDEEVGNRSNILQRY